MKKLQFFFIALSSLSGISAQIDRSIQPKSAPTPLIQLDEPQSFTLKNGMTILVVENHKLPKVSISLSIDNPPIFEGKLTGANSLLGSMLDKGSLNIEKTPSKKKLILWEPP